MITRRVFVGAVPALSAATGAAPALPDRANFRVQQFETCLNAGRWHPLSNGARAAVDKYQEYEQRGIFEVQSIGNDFGARFWQPQRPHHQVLSRRSTLHEGNLIRGGVNPFGEQPFGLRLRPAMRIRTVEPL